MCAAALQYARQVRKALLALATLVVLIPVAVLGQAPSPNSELPSAPSAKAAAPSTRQSNTGRNGAGQSSSVESGKESLTKQADYFVPMTNRERWDHYLYSVVGPQAFLYPAVQAGLNQARNTPYEWAQGADGYGRRIGSAYGQHLIDSTVGTALAFGLHEDNRHFKSGKAGKGRVSYAITSAFLARHDDGSRSISFSAIGGDATGAFISRIWMPKSINSAGNGALAFAYAIAARAGINVAREFLPRRFERVLK